MKVLRNKNILVTGVSSTIGAGVAKALMKEGSFVYGTFRTAEHLSLAFPKIPSELTTIPWSIGEDLSFLENLSTLDGWVHCIGAIHPLPIKYLNAKGNQDLFAVNYFSATEIAAKLLLLKKIKPNGSIVFLSSISSHFPYRGGSSYAASKAALESFSKALALECSHIPVRVNNIACGLIRSEMFNRSVAHLEKQKEEEVISKYPLGIGESSDVANACVFLLSEKAKWITGSQLLLDGGLMLNP